MLKKLKIRKKEWGNGGNNPNKILAWSVKPHQGTPVTLTELLLNHKNT